MQAAAAAPLGTRANPISRPLFNAQVLYRVVNLDPSGRVTGVKTPQAGEGAFFARKVAPTLVLFPPAGELTAELEPGMRGADGECTSTRWLPAPKGLPVGRPQHHGHNILELAVSIRRQNA